MDNTKTATAQMLIRETPAKVFDAFIRPEVTTEFWFSKGSDELELDKAVQWHWEMYGFSNTAIARKIDHGRRLVFDWHEGDKNSEHTTVEITFEPHSDDYTFVKVKHYGFKETGDELIEKLKDSTGGFYLVLAGLKAFMEHGVMLNLIADHDPEHVKEDWDVSVHS